MLAALDTRKAISAANAAVAGAHQEMIGDGAPFLKTWGTADELDRYRRTVEMVVEKLDKRDQLRGTDSFREALVSLHTLGEQLAYPGPAAGATENTAPKAHVIEARPEAKPETFNNSGLAVEPKRGRKAAFQDLRTILEANGYDSAAEASDVSALERELAGLQNELASFQAAS
jgi:hypothetical protein